MSSRTQRFTPQTTQEPVLSPEPQVESLGTQEVSQEPTEAPTPTPTSPPTLSAAPLVQSASDKVPTPAGNQHQANALTLESVIEGVKRSGSVQANTAINGMEAYIAKMTPNKILDKNEGPNAQSSLWRTLRGVLENTNEEFNQTYSIILGLFEKHKNGVFHERYVFRFMADAPLSKDELFAFQAIINLIKLTADPVSRNSALKQVDIARSLGKVFSENARQRILGFYGL